MQRRPTPLRERLASHVVFDPSGCFIFTGSLDRDGYGVISEGTGSDRRQLRAHRAAWEIYRGPIPPGMTLDHLCRVRNCVNVMHLEPVSNKTNIQRGYAVRPLRTHCQRGHEFTDENTGRHPNGKRFCRRCQYDANARYRQRRLASSSSLSS